MSQNQNKRTLRTIGLVVAVTLLTKILGIVREALQAGVFGTQTAFDLYTISYNYTIYIFTTVAYALCIAAVPVISRHLAEDRNKAFAVAGNLICVSVLVSALVVVLLSVLIRFAPVGHWLGVSDADLPTLRTYLQICLLTLPLIVVIYLLVAVFQSMEHYTLQGSLSLPYNLLLIVFLVLFSSSERVLEYVLVICFAWLLQFAMTIPCIVREKFRLIPGLHFRDPDLRLFARTTVVTVFTTSIFLLCYLADSNTVSAFGSGAVSAVYYADKLFTPVATTLIYSISVVLFPKYNLTYSQVNAQEYKRYVGGTVENTLFVILPFSALFSAFAVPIIHVLFESGNFNTVSTQMTSSVFAMHALGMAGFCVPDQQGILHHAQDADAAAHQCRGAGAEHCAQPRVPERSELRPDRTDDRRVADRRRCHCARLLLPRHARQSAHRQAAQKPRCRRADRHGDVGVRKSAVPAGTEQAPDPAGILRTRPCRHRAVRRHLLAAARAGGTADDRAKI